jgi:hypothetical protein
VLCSCLLQMENTMCLIPGLCPRCHTAQILKRRKTKVHICNTTVIRIRQRDVADGYHPPPEAPVLSASMQAGFDF